MSKHSIDTHLFHHNISIDDLVIKILDYYSRNNDKSVVTFACVSKQWYRCIHELPFIGLSDRLFLEDYDDFSLSSFNHLKGIRLVGDIDTMTIGENKGELFTSRVCEKLAPLRGTKRIESLVINTRCDIFNQYILSRYFSHVKMLTTQHSRSLTWYPDLKLVLPHLDCLRFVEDDLEIISIIDISHFDYIPLVDASSTCLCLSDVIRGGTTHKRTGKTIIKLDLNGGTKVVECSLINGKLDTNTPVSQTMTRNGDYHSHYNGTLDKNFNYHGKGTLYIGGSMFEGEWVGGKLEGRGKEVVEATGFVKYDGEWVGNKMHGKGTLNFTSGPSFEGDWKEGWIIGVGKCVDKTHSYEYHGEFKGFRWHGKGVLYDLCASPTRETYYKGGHNNSENHGKGKIVVNGKEIVKGEFSFDKLIKGRLHTPDDKHILIGSFDTTLGKFKGNVYSLVKTTSEEEELDIDDYLHDHHTADLLKGLGM